jgi:hypothetical protein
MEVWDMIINSIQTYTNIFLFESLNLRKEWFMIFLLFVFYIYNNESLVPNIFSKIKVNLVQIVLVNTDLFRLVKLKALPYRFRVWR